MRRMHLGCVPDHHLLALHLWSTDGLNAKDFPLLRSVVAARVPSRLLVFGLSPQLLALAAVNSGQGTATAFVEDADSARGVLVGRGPRVSATVHRARYPDPSGGVGGAAAREVEPGVPVPDGDCAQVGLPAGSDLFAAGGA